MQFDITFLSVALRDSESPEAMQFRGARLPGLDGACAQLADPQSRMASSRKRSTGELNQPNLNFSGRYWKTATMKALQLRGYGGNGKLQVVDVPQPEPATGEVLIGVHYAGLNPVDYKTRNGMLRVVQPYSLPVTMGNEVAGDIAAVGANVAGWAAGTKCWCDWPRSAWAAFGVRRDRCLAVGPQAARTADGRRRRRAAGRADRLAVSVRIWPHR